jgi:group I intron endonuclease
VVVHPRTLTLQGAISMNIYSIYKVINSINNKVYIGYTSKPLEKRKLEHFERSSNNSKTRFHLALRKYGVENFVWEVVYQSLDKNHCKNTMESFFINEFDSYRIGYNSTKGGDGLDSETMRAIRKDPSSVYNSTEYKTKRSEIQKRVRSDPNSKFNCGDFKKKVSANMRKMRDDPNSTFNSEEYRKKLSDGAKRFWANRKKSQPT